MSEPEDLGPCPLCGEADLLNFREGYDCEAVVVDVDGERLILEPLSITDARRDNRNFAMIDHVACLLCGVCMPLRTWQGWRPTPAAREMYRSYYEDDEPQAWEQRA